MSNSGPQAEPSVEQLAASLQRSLDMPLPDQVAELSALQFAGSYRGTASWAVGPFTHAPEMTFTLDAQWEDPTRIGWTSGAVFNPTLLPIGDDLHMFYRAAPRKETMDSRIGHAVFDRRDGRWRDDPANPVVYPTTMDELWGCEDPKAYRGPDGYYLAYNGAWPIGDAEGASERDQLYSAEIGCDIKLAHSTDLSRWTKVGRIVPRDVSRMWAKAAVIPRDAAGNAVALAGEYLMFLSEGCGGRLTVGRSTDMRSWRFEAVPYLDISSQGVLHEVATALVLPGRTHFVLDYFYDDSEGLYRAGQALYRVDRPFQQLELNEGGTLAWGGIVEWEGSWLFAQGWDAPEGIREISFYTSPVSTALTPRARS